MLCTSCASYNKYELPLQEGTSFTQSGSAYLENLWWLSLNDEELNTHIETALNNNFSLAATWDRLTAARALSARERANLYPDLDLDANARRTIDDDNTNEERFTFGPTASYEVDLWGEIRASNAAEYLRAEASEQAYRTAALTLSSNVAIVWVRLLETQHQQNLLQEQISTNQKALEVLRVRFGVGQIRSEDILRQQLLIERLKEEKISVEADMKLLEHQLAVLRGEPPQHKSFKTNERLPELPPLPDTGLSSDLIQRRPDIKEAFLQIQAADKDLAAAIRDQYPEITLSASYISEAARAGTLFSNWITTLAGGIVAPLFDGGERRAEVRRGEATRNEFINLYAQNVLVAFQEVEDALIQEDTQRRRISNLQSRVKLARDSYKQIRLGYFNGANEFISVLSAQDELQSTERDLLRARRDLIEFRIALYRALAGGFQTPREQIAEK